MSRHDELFQATARSSRASTVYLTQSIPTLAAAIGTERDSRSLVDSLLNNLGTKIFHANSDATTNEYASKLIGKQLQRFRSESRSIGSASQGFLPNITNTRGFSEQLSEIVRPDQFAMMTKGGPENGYRVSAVIVQTGRMWHSGKWSYTVTTFNQRPNAAPVPPPPAPKPRPLSSQISYLLFPWVGNERGDWMRWVVAAGFWFMGAPLIALSAIVAIRGILPFNQTAVQNAPQSQGVAAPKEAPPIPQKPIPIKVHFIPNPAGSHGTAVFTSTEENLIPFTAKVTSRPSGITREYGLNASAHYSPTITRYDGGGIQDGDEVEVSNPRFEPVTATFHHPAPFPPIPVQVKFNPEPDGLRSKVYFTTTAEQGLSFAVKVTSSRSGVPREDSFNASPHYSPWLSWEIEDGDVIEVSNPEYKPVTVTFHRPGMPR